MKEGIVIKSTGIWYNVKEISGKVHPCRIRGKLRLKGIKSTNPIAVGDRVSFLLEDDDKNGIIHDIHERKNFISRKSVNLSKESHVIAANLDLALLFITTKQPDTSLGFIDRFLVTSEAYGIDTILIFNKIDIYSPSEIDEIDDLILMYQKIGYSSIKTSATTLSNLKEVEKVTTNKIILLAGQSGAGKSTLINAMNPNLNIRTGEISESHFKGKHTTTHAEMHEMANGGFIIDTPGIKGFGLLDLSKENLHHYFPEIFRKLPECKFHNCKHINEPKCAVKKAVDKGEINDCRYQNYLKMYNEEDGPYRSLGY